MYSGCRLSYLTAIARGRRLRVCLPHFYTCEQDVKAGSEKFCSGLMLPLPIWAAAVLLLSGFKGARCAICDVGIVMLGMGLSRVVAGYTLVLCWVWGLGVWLGMF